MLYARGSVSGDGEQAVTLSGGTRMRQADPVIFYETLEDLAGLSVNLKFNYRIATIKIREVGVRMNE